MYLDDRNKLVSEPARALKAQEFEIVPKGVKSAGLFWSDEFSTNEEVSTDKRRLKELWRKIFQAKTLDPRFCCEGAIVYYSVQA